MAAVHRARRAASISPRLLFFCTMRRPTERIVLDQSACPVAVRARVGMRRLVSVRLLLGWRPLWPRWPSRPRLSPPIGVAPAYNPPLVYRPLIYNWTGFYFGGHVGARHARGFRHPDHDHHAVQTPAPRPTSTPSASSAAPSSASTTSSRHGSSASRARSPRPYLSGSNNRVDAVERVERHHRARRHRRSIGTPPRPGRFGYAINDLLIYGKGGARLDARDLHPGYSPEQCQIGSQVIPDTRMGFVVGAGVEYGISENLSVKIEYDFLDFGSKTYTFGAPGRGAARGDRARRRDQGRHAACSPSGINYRFNWGGGGPVVAARY